MPHFRYVPILRWKEGEEDALSFLNAPQKTDVVPLIALLGPQFKDQKQTKKRAAVPAPIYFVDRILSCWCSQPFYLDARNIPTPANGPHPIAAISAVAQSKGANLIPATHLSAPSGYAHAVFTIAQTQRAGIALRITLNEVSSAPHWVASWPIPLQETDLIIDLQDTAPIVQGLQTVVQSALAGLHNSSSWRTVTIAGTSMPANFSGLSQGLHLIPRSEFVLWQNLHPTLSYRLDYGDYTTPPIADPPTGMRYGYPINVRYTLVSSFLICKGVSPRGFGSSPQSTQLTAHANSIKNYPNRAPLTNCWADTEIDAIAVGKSPQTLGYWVTIGVNRHISITRHTVP